MNTDYSSIPSGQVVDTVKIDSALARRLSDLLSIQSIRQSLLLQLLDNIDSYNKVEQMLIPITDEINQIKNQITLYEVPDQYKDPMFIWSYDGWATNEDKINIIKV